MARKSYHANRVLSEESKTAAEAVKYASDNNQVATVTETVRGFEVSIPSPSGVLAALMEKSTELHAQCAQILREIGDANNDVRTRGQKRRHYNQLMKTIVEYQRVIGRLMDKNVVRDVWTVEETIEEPSEEEPKPKATKPKATKPKAKAKSKAKAKPKASGTSNRSKLEKMSYKELQAYCKKRNIGSGGTKAALIERILGRLGE